LLSGAERQTDGIPLKIQKEQRDVRLLLPFFSCHSEAKSGDGLILRCPGMHQKYNCVGVELRRVCKKILPAKINMLKYYNMLNI